MGILIFHAAQLRRIVDHAKAAPEHDMGSDQEPEPAVTLVGDHGVYLISNGLPRDKRRTGEARNFVAHALGINPYQDNDWFETKRALYGDDDGVDTLCIIDTLDLILNQGERFIRLQVGDGDIGILIPDFSWIQEGAMVKTPSNLGGVFEARVLSTTETHAELQNSGNSEDFDQMPPYSVPLAQMSPLKSKERA